MAIDFTPGVFGLFGDLSPVEAALPGVFASLCALPHGQVIWEGQGIQRPSLPYLSLWHTNARRITPDPEVVHSANPSGHAGNPAATPPVIGTELKTEYRTPAEFVLRIQAHTVRVVGAESAEKILARLDQALDLSAVTEALHSSGLVLIRRGPVLSVPSFVEPHLEGHAVLELEFRLWVGSWELGTYIGQAEIAPRYNEASGAPFLAPKDPV